MSATAPGHDAVVWRGDGQDRETSADGQRGPSSRSRLVDLDPHGEVTLTRVIGRPALAGEGRVSGPCVVEEPAATTLVLPGQTVCADELGNLVIEEGA